MAFAQSLQSALTMKLEAAGVSVGTGPSNDVIVHDDSIYEQIFFNGTLGIGESYVQGKWDSPNLRDVLLKGVQAGVPLNTLDIPYRVLKFCHLLFNPESSKKEQKIADHYNTGTELFHEMLGKMMAYTCGYTGRGGETLDQIQRDKLSLSCEKLYLEPGHTLLDIGCGFGSLAKHAAWKHRVKVTGITISEDQLLDGRKLCDGLDVDLRFMNYLDLLENFEPHSFDRIASLGMFEHVGPKNYARYMEIVRTLLKPGGLFLLHTIGGEGYDAWMNKYIFPGGVLPNDEQIIRAYRSQHFVMEDWHNFGADYAVTLNFWRQNFEAAWPDLKLTGRFGATDEECERFYRMWIFYLTSCEAIFKARAAHLWQIVLSPNGVPGGYVPVR